MVPPTRRQARLLARGWMPERVLQLVSRPGQECRLVGRNLGATLLDVVLLLLLGLGGTKA